MFDLIYRFNPTEDKSLQAPRSAHEACRLLVQGNREFAEIAGAYRGGKNSCVIPSDPRAFGWNPAGAELPMQAPFAAILGCADARVPPELVLSKGCNELFVVRIAGNVLGNECLGSLRYAVSNFTSTLKVIVVLAHANCGAVTEAVNAYLDPGRYIDIASDYSVRSLEDHMLVAVRIAALGLEEIYGAEVFTKPGARAALLEVGVVLNAAWSAYCLRQEFSEKFPELGVVYGAYDLISRYVRLPLSPHDALTEEEKGLFAPPEDAAGFHELSRRICRGKFIRDLLLDQAA
ncbi:MAG TPA: carbonic anhydrase [Terriglobales bacterium]